jgi:hypothetical protein
MSRQRGGFRYPSLLQVLGDSMRHLAQVLILSSAAILFGSAQPVPLPPISVAEPGFHFDIRGITEPVDHVFWFKNNTAEILQPTKVMVTKPLVFDAISPKVNPNEEGVIRFHLGAPRKLGVFDGAVEVAFKNPGVSNLVFEVTGRITPWVEVAPIPAFFAAVQRGQTNQTSLQLINHENTPLQILGIEHTSTRFQTHLQTNEPGQRYTLFLTLRGEGKSGDLSERIFVRTSSLKQPRLLITANTRIKDRVNIFPDEVDFESVDLAALRKTPALTNLVAQTLMVYQHGGTNFEVTAKISLPFLKVDAEPAITHDRWQITIRPTPQEMTPGDFEGMLVLQTNDPEFARLDVPVRIAVRQGSSRTQKKAVPQP